MKGNTNDMKTKDTKDQKSHSTMREPTKKRYFLLWDVETIVVNNEPMTVTFPMNE
jgi:hypothetical protein